MFEIVNESSLRGILKSLNENEVISLDTETDGLDTLSANPLLLQAKIGDSTFLFEYPKNRNLIQYFIRLVKDSGKLCLFHNSKFDLKIIYRMTGEWLNNVYDTMLAETLIYQGIGSKFYSLADLVTKYTGEVLDKTLQTSFENVSGNLTQEQLMYAALDVKHLEKIMLAQSSKLAEQKQTKILSLEMKLLPVVAKMEFRGITLDQKKWTDLEDSAKLESTKYHDLMLLDIKVTLDKMIKECYDYMDIVEKLCIPVTTKRLKAYIKQLQTDGFVDVFVEWVMQNINFNSHKQVLAYLNLSGVDIPDTNEKTLLKFKKVPFVENLLLMREAEKKISTYGTDFFKYINNRTGRVHSEANQVGTDTGRFSYSKPNLQNIPKINAYRAAFVARPGYKLVTADYSQAELRMLAAVSKETEMIDAFIHGIDLHKKTASILFNKPVEEVTDEERKPGKTLNFAVVYGTSEYGLEHNFGILLADGRRYLDSYFAGYKMLDKFLKLAGDKILELCYSVTPMGRRRFFEKKVMYSDYKERNKIEGAIRREGINHIIQGCSADVTKIAMVDIDTKNPFGEDTINLLLQVHDELVIEVREDILEDGVEFIKKCMLEAEQPFLGLVPAAIDVHVADFWQK